MRAHKAVCPYCDELIELLADLEIDHIIPESLSNEALTTLLKELGKPDLDIQSYYNWFPSHPWCNRRKRAIVPAKTSLHFWLMIAENKVPSVLEEERKFERQARANDALAAVARQIETGALTIGIVNAVLSRTQLPAARKFDPTILSFSIHLAKVKPSDPKYDSPVEILLNQDTADAQGAAFSAETLESELKDALSGLNALIVRSEEIQNSGETLSVRYAVWPLDLDRLPERFPNAWELLEIAPFSEVYPNSDPGELMDKAIILRRNELIIDYDSHDPLAYRYCPNCGTSSEKLHRISYAIGDETIYLIRCDCGWAERF
jgi:hypothetical protein